MTWLDDDFIVVDGGSQTESCLEVYYAATGRCICRLGGVYAPVTSVLRVNDVLFTAHKDGLIYAWDAHAIIRWCTDKILMGDNDELRYRRRARRSRRGGEVPGDILPFGMSVPCSALGFAGQNAETA